MTSDPASAASFCSSHSRTREGSRSPWSSFKQALSISTPSWPIPSKLKYHFADADGLPTASTRPISSLSSSAWLPTPVQSVSMPSSGLSGWLGSSDVD